MAEWPHRQRLMIVRPARPKGFPSGSTISKSPSTRMDPLCLTVIFVVAIFSPAPHKVCPHFRTATSGNDSCANLREALSLHTTQNSENKSVFWNVRINLVGPREDSALQVKNFAEPRFA